MARIVIAGGSGYIGQALVTEFSLEGYEVVVLSRTNRPVPGARVVAWDAASPSESWYREIDGAEAVVNLCGERLLQRWSPAARARIRESRLGPTCLIGAAIAASTDPARTWVNASATGWYGDTGGKEVSEASPASDDYLGQLCRDWESEVDKAETPGTRRVKLRIGLVLGRDSEALKRLSLLARAFMGGPIGSGRQYMPWIHERDLARLFAWCVTSDVLGAVNATAPNPVTNAEFMRELRSAVGRPGAPGLPSGLAMAVCDAMGWEKVMMLGGTRAVPAIACGRGFEFRFPTLSEALHDLLSEVPKAWKTPMLAA